MQSLVSCQRINQAKQRLKKLRSSPPTSHSDSSLDSHVASDATAAAEKKADEKVLTCAPETSASERKAAAAASSSMSVTAATVATGSKSPEALIERRLSGVDWESLSAEQLREMVRAWKRIIEENQVSEHVISLSVVHTRCEQEQMKQWAHNCPETFAVKWSLVQAEVSCFTRVCTKLSLVSLAVLSRDELQAARREAVRPSDQRGACERARPQRSAGNELPAWISIADSLGEQASELAARHWIQRKVANFARLLITDACALAPLDRLLSTKKTLVEQITRTRCGARVARCALSALKWIRRLSLRRAHAFQV